MLIIDYGLQNSKFVKHVSDQRGNSMNLWYCCRKKIIFYEHEFVGFIFYMNALNNDAVWFV